MEYRRKDERVKSETEKKKDKSEQSQGLKY